ncbi:phosphohistidine phosphatase [Streptomyces alboflavus]|uniref:Phosphohistidine phosphatase n=1 Tax=Streptomyces alboflavus TaxID=67267 RepID=A0A1Z1W7X4_9ACTN|nr:phosphohistidine phosphatase [Streptomyces alboflavus]
MSDHERPLAERGRRDAPVAGRRLAESGIAFDLALCSTAARTRETWKLAVPELTQRPRTVYEDRVYEASPGELIAVLNETPDDVRDLILIGHNPGVHGLADVLSGEAEGDAQVRMNRRGFPTSAFAVLTYTGSWKSLEPGTATLVDYWAPSE